MEWDTVESAGVIQQFESFVTAKLVDLRQKQWRECTSFVTDIRQLINQLRSDFETGVVRLNEDKAELLKEIEKRDCMVEGKELEILGLRHQLKSLLMSKAICTKCACEIVAPEIQLNKTSQDSIKNRKRARFNLSVSTSVDSSTKLAAPPGAAPAYLHRRPSEKRRCLGDLNGQLALDVYAQNGVGKSEPPCVLVVDTQNDELSCDEDLSLTNTLTEGGTREHTNFSSVQSNFALTVSNVAQSPTLERLDSAITRRPIGIATFSPPSQTFDASKIIRGAVNHLDLEDYEPSVVVPPQSSKISKHLHFSPLPGPQNSHISRVHKPSCRHYKSIMANDKSPKNLRHPPDVISDVTGADLTFPSISTSSGVVVGDVTSHTENMNVLVKTTSMPPPPAPPIPSKHVPLPNPTLKKSSEPSVDVFPSLGGSPTPVVSNPQRNIETQLETLEKSPSKKSPEKQDVNRIQPITISAAIEDFQSRVSDATAPRKVAVTCRDCEKYYQAAGYSSEEIAKRLLASGKHKHLIMPGVSIDTKMPPSTPEGFWNLGGIQTQSGDALGDKQTSSSVEKQTVRRSRRRKPLGFRKRYS